MPGVGSRLAKRTLTSHLTALGFNFQAGIIIMPTSLGYCEDYNDKICFKALRTRLAYSKCLIHISTLALLLESTVLLERQSGGAGDCGGRSRDVLVLRRHPGWSPRRGFLPSLTQHLRIECPVLRKRPLPLLKFPFPLGELELKC